MTTGTTPTIKIVIVAGQEFSVPAETDNEAIRQQLTGMGFADVASATISKGKRAVEGQGEVETIEFVKRAGTKGLVPAQLGELLGTAAARSAVTLPEGGAGDQAGIIRQLLAGTLTYGEAVRLGVAFERALSAVSNEGCGQVRTAEERVCDRLDLVPAEAAGDMCAW